MHPSPKSEASQPCQPCQGTRQLEMNPVDQSIIWEEFSAAETTVIANEVLCMEMARIRRQVMLIGYHVIVHHSQVYTSQLGFHAVIALELQQSWQW